MATTEEIKLRLKLQVNKFKKSLSDIKKKTNSFVKNSTKGFKSIEKSAARSMNEVAVQINTKFIGALALAQTAFAALNLEAVKNAKEIKNWSEVLGIGTTDLQRFQAALKTVGFEGDKATDILKDVNDKIGDFIATGGGEAKNILERLGIDKRTLQEQDPVGNLKTIVKQMEKLKVSGKERVFLMEALANDAAKLLPLLEKGGAAMDKIADRAQLAGALMSPQEIQSLTEIGSEFDSLKEEFVGFSKALLVKLKPAIMVLIGTLKNLLKFMDAFIERAIKLTQALGKGLGEVFGRLAASFEGIKDFNVQGLLAPTGKNVDRENIYEDMLARAHELAINSIKKTSDTITKVYNSIDLKQKENLEKEADSVSTFFGGTVKFDKSANKIIAALKQRGAGEAARIFSTGALPQARSKEFDKLAGDFVQSLDRGSVSMNQFESTIRRMNQIIASFQTRPGTTTSGMQAARNQIVDLYKEMFPPNLMKNADAVQRQQKVQIEIIPNKEFDTRVRQQTIVQVGSTFGDEAAFIGK